MNHADMSRPTAVRFLFVKEAWTYVYNIQSSGLTPAEWTEKAIKVKGKDAAFSVFQLVGEKSSVASAEMRYPEQYRAGLERYRAGDFTAAEEIWRCQAKQSDGGTVVPSPPLIMAGRCADLKSAPPAGWDGVFVKTSK